MNKPMITLGFLACLSLVVLAAPSTPAVDLTGTWTGSTVLNNGQGATLELTLVLNKAGQSYSGTINDSLGLIDKDSAIADVKLAGNEFSFSFKGLGGALELAGSFTVTGDKMTGKLEDKTNGNDTPFEFARRK
jgi:hypothetical protein